MLPQMVLGSITNEGRIVLQMYILSFLLGLSMPAFSFLFVELSGDVEGTETRPHIKIYILTHIK